MVFEKPSHISGRNAKKHYKNMTIYQYNFQSRVWNNADSSKHTNAQLVFCFGKRELLQTSNLASVFKKFPNAQFVSGSTAGEIHNTGIAQDSIVCTALEFDKAHVHSRKVNVTDYENSKAAGAALVRDIAEEGLKLIFVLSDGQLVNGSDLLTGINEELKGTIPVVGGLAGDGDAFQHTLVGLGDDIAEGNIVAIGFYGDSLNIGYGSAGGWEAFGPTRVVTESDKNVLYKLDGKSALELYIRYLGDYAKDLPCSALLFPLAVQSDDTQEPLVRTILSIDREAQSMTFAGNIPEGAKVQLMRTNLDNLADAAAEAAEAAQQVSSDRKPELSILISCVGRRIIFDQRIEEEWEEIREVLGNAMLTGFYSYGEISPALPHLNCQLYNQTMTITTISESK